VTELRFSVTGAAPAEAGVEPQIALILRVACADPAHVVRALLLRCQVRIEAARRPYGDDEAARLEDLFGARPRWSETQRSLLWANLHVNVPGFTGATEVELRLPCGFDFALAHVKYLDAVRAGPLPLRLLFSGTIFSAQDEALAAAPIPWSAEVQHALPAELCQVVRDRSLGGCIPLAVRRDVFDRLYGYRRRHGLTNWESTLERLLACEDLS
jgi:hypothetical protein